MKTIVIISVHATTKNCFSSANFNGYNEFDSTEQAMSFIKENEFVVSETLADSELNLRLVYLTTYEYNRNRERVEQLFIKGFSPDAQIYWDKQESIKNAKRKEEGYVYCKKHKK